MSNNPSGYRFGGALVEQDVGATRRSLLQRSRITGKNSGKVVNPGSCQRIGAHT
jgi:hypothetical protein